MFLLSFKLSKVSRKPFYSSVLLAVVSILMPKRGKLFNFEAVKFETVEFEKF